MGNLSALGNTVVQTTPVGVIEAFAGVNAPAGWLFCDGSAISRVQYPELFSALSTTYGSGDGSTTFNLPDMRGRMPVGKGTHTDVATLGNNEGASLANRRPKHQHTVYDAGHTHAPRMNGGLQVYRANVAAGSGEYGITSANTGSIVDNSTNTTGVRVNPEGAASSTSPTDAPPYLVVNYIIKAVADLPRGGWFYQNNPPVVTQLPSNPQIGEQVYLYSAYGYIYQRYNGSSWDIISDNRKVYFQAHTNAILGTTAGATMAFNRTISNQGSCFNTSTYLFTAPFAGDYKFRTQVQKRNAGVLQLYWIINGSTTNNRGVYTDIGNDSLGPNMEVILNLAANATVGVYYTLSAGDVYGSAQEYFSYFQGMYLK